MFMKILIVDENQTITTMLSQMLDLLGSYEIDVANNGYQAMDKMLSFNPKLVILDLSMPGMSGQDTLIKIKEINPNTKVIIASAHDDDKTKDFCLRNGASGYLTKPYTVSDVSDEIKSVLASGKYGANENIFLTSINEKLAQNFAGIFGKNQRIEFQTAQLKKNTSVQNIGVSASETMHSSQSELPTLEIPDEQRGFTTELSGKISGSIISVVPDKFVAMIQSFSGDTIGIGGSDDLLEFFNILNGAVLSATGNFLKVQIKSNPVRPFDSQRDKTVNDMDLMEINYTFELGDRNTWFTIYLWMNIFESFENKLNELICYGVENNE